MRLCYIGKRWFLSDHPSAAPGLSVATQPGFEAPHLGSRFSLNFELPNLARPLGDPLRAPGFFLVDPVRVPGLGSTSACPDHTQTRTTWPPWTR